MKSTVLQFLCAVKTNSRSKKPFDAFRVADTNLNVTTLLEPGSWIGHRPFLKYASNCLKCFFATFVSRGMKQFNYGAVQLPQQEIAAAVDVLVARQRNVRRRT